MGNVTSWELKTSFSATVHTLSSDWHANGEESETDDNEDADDDNDHQSCMSA